ncbi:tyrosine-type recombinase/integrase [Chlorobium phaeobacteroides]|nr:site-specific integrase [Chlorobium phaeobacteroides]
MGVKVRERKMASGEVAFYIDTYHKDYGRFSQKTGLQVNPKNRKEHRDVLAEAQDKARQIEKDLVRNPAGVFDRKVKAADDFIEFYRRYAEKDNYPKYANVLPILRRFSLGVIHFASLNSAWLERFKFYLLSLESISQNTAGGYLTSVKTVLRQAFREGYLIEDISAKVPGIKKTDIQRHFLPVEQVEALHKAKSNNEMIKQAFLFACFSGLRLSDVQALYWEQISQINGAPYIQFRQRKTCQYENLPLSEQAATILQEVRALHAEYAPSGSDKVFILPSRERIAQVLEVWGIRAGLPFKLHFHVSRHTFATMNLTAGCDLYTVSKLLGHREIKTTQIYGRIVDSKKLDAVQALPVLQGAIGNGAATAGIQQTGLLPSVGKSPVVQALEAEGERVARALKLQRNGSGRYEFGGREYTAAELAIEVSGGD